MHKLEDKEMTRFFADMHIPAAASNLESRILTAATARNSQAVKPRTGFGLAFFSSWRWNQPKLAMVYAMAAVTIAVGISFQSPDMPGQAPASQQIAQHDRYSVDGMNLLEDIDLSVDSEYEMAEIAADLDGRL